MDEKLLQRMRSETAKLHTTDASLRAIESGELSKITAQWSASQGHKNVDSTTLLGWMGVQQTAVTEHRKRVSEKVDNINQLVNEISESPKKPDEANEPLQEACDAALDFNLTAKDELKSAVEVLDALRDKWIESGEPGGPDSATMLRLVEQQRGQVNEIRESHSNQLSKAVQQLERALARCRG